MVDRAICANCGHDNADTFNFSLAVSYFDLENRTASRSIARRPERSHLEVSEQAMNVHWGRATRMMVDSLTKGGKASPLDALRDITRRPTQSLPTDSEDEHIANNPFVLRGLRAVAAVLYEQECSGKLFLGTRPDSKSSTNAKPAWGTMDSSDLVEFEIADVLNQMARLDYGMVGFSHNSGVGEKSPQTSGPAPSTSRPHHAKLRKRCNQITDALIYMAEGVRLGEFFERELWENIGRALGNTSQIDPADIAISLYHLETHRNTALERDRNLSDYTGVLTEMIDEVPTQGTERLARKLATDIELFHRWSDNQAECDQMRREAERIANEHCLKLWQNGIPPPRRMVGRGQGSCCVM